VRRSRVPKVCFRSSKTVRRAIQAFGPCISIDTLTSQGRIIGSQEIVQGRTTWVTCGSEEPHHQPP
jgi:hypothetical protein